MVNSAGGSLCWNYATDTFYSNYAGTNACCNYAGFEVLLQLCWWCYTYVGGSFVAVIKVTVSVATMQLAVSATHTQVKVSAANMWVTIFIEMMQVGVSVAIMQVVFSTVHYALCTSLLLL